ncbi:hypothetical protein [cyanobacterium endosymbiont of Rhopalodia gibberula]|nr:hypothetical protein [cyanobacterium endosymbiont of Rhopalodia gibberula]
MRSPVPIIQTSVQMTLAYSEVDPQQRQLKVVGYLGYLTQQLGNLVNDLF